MLLCLLAAPAARAQAPIWSGVSPRGAQPGQLITLTGTGFSGAVGATGTGVATPTSSGSFRLTGLAVTAISPARGQRNAPAGSPVSLAFNAPLRNDAATRGSLTVFSRQRGGRLTDGAGGSTTVSGSTLSFAPTTNFRPGETVYSTVTTAARNDANTLSLGAGHVSQFTVATGGLGLGVFAARSQQSIGGSISLEADDVAVGDVDGDGDLDAVGVTNTATGQVVLNDGSGLLSAGSTVALVTKQRQAELADVDGDGDLDLLVLSISDGTFTPNPTGTLTGSLCIRLNDGSGNFGGGQTLALPTAATALAVGDIDGDGDLDAVLCAFNGASTLRNLYTYRNTGGSFALNLTQTVSSYSFGLTLADFDQDGDLDLAIGGASTAQVLVLWNGGDNSGSNPGTFSNPLTVTSPDVSDVTGLVAGDIDNDGDLDLVLQGNFFGRLGIVLNGGDATGANVGTFGPGSTFNASGYNAGHLSLGDVDADGDLDILAAGRGSNPNTYVFRNGGDATGANAGQFANTASSAYGVTNVSSGRLGDMDGDGDLDLVVANNVLVGVALNHRPATLLSAAPAPVAAGGTLVVTGQYLTGATAFRFSGQTTQTSGFTVDSDTQLTLTVPANTPAGSLTLTITTPYRGNNTLAVTVVPAPTLAAGSAAAELPGQALTLTGTGFGSGTSVSFGGVAAGSITVSSATSLTAVVPAGAPVGSAPVVLSYAGASAAALPFTVLEVYNGGAVGSCQAAVPATATVADGQWHYLLSSSGQVVAAYSYSGASLGDFALDLLRADPAQPVRKSGNSSRYLDRNWHLTTSGGAFTGRTVQLRLYGLASELTRLQDADLAATPATLHATQYSGPNEDCSLSNNNFTAGELRSLPAPASTFAGSQPWFVSELTVADHFSEFYLTAASSPLPVELTAFTAAVEGNAAVRLRWTTASEQNSRTFDVERSLDGRTFAPIGAVAAAGSSTSVRRYELLDPPPFSPSGTLYYRLRQMDIDGSFSYSPVRTVQLTNSSTHQLTIFPNPAHGTATLRGLAPGTAVTVFDALGRPVAVATADAAGSAALLLPAGLPAGVYVVRAGARALRLVRE